MIASALQALGILWSSTNRRGRRWSSRRRVCIRRDRLAFCAERGIGGSRGPEVGVLLQILEGLVRGVGSTYVWCWAAALEVRFDRFVLLVELGEVWDEVLDNVGVRKRVDAGFLRRVGGDAALISD